METVIIKDFSINGNYLNEQGYFCIEIKGDNFSKIIFYDTLIKEFEKKGSKLYRYFIMPNKYICFNLNKIGNFYNIIFDDICSLNFYSKSKSVKITNDKGITNEYKVYTPFNIYFLIEKSNLSDFIFLDKKGDEIDEKDIIYNKYINIKLSSKKKESFEEFFSKKDCIKKDEKYSYSLNFDLYFNTKDFSYINTEERKKLEYQLNIFLLDPNRKIFCLTGISGIGKSISLLHFLKINTSYSRCYLNVRELYKHYEDDLINKEAFKLFSDKKLFLNIIKENTAQNFWDKIDKILSNLPRNKTDSILIFDQYKTSYDNNFNHIINIINKYTKLKIIICSSINDNNIRENVINCNWIRKNMHKTCFDFYYIEDNLVNMKDHIQKEKELCEFMKLFDYLPKFINNFINSFDNYTTETKNKYLNSNLEFYKNNLKKFYHEKKIHLIEKYKIISLLIENKEVLTESELNEIIDYLPLKYIKIIKDKDGMFYINYSFPFFSQIFKSYYLEELYQLYKINMLNLGKNAEIGNNLDDIVNLKFGINSTVGEITIKHKIIIDRISDFKKVFQVVNEDNLSMEYKLNFKNYLIKEPMKVNLDSFLGDHQPIFIEQYFQGKDFDGSILIPFKDVEGNYDIFLYQTSVLKKIKFSRDYIYEQYIKIKKKFEEIFSIKIVNGYFSYILYFENPDINTEIHCSHNYLNYIFYSINSNEFVDSKGKKVTSFLNDTALIYKSEKISIFMNFQKEFNFFKNCLMYSMKKEKKIKNSSQNKTFLKKVIMLNKLSEDTNNEDKKETLKKEMLNRQIKLNKIINFNKSLFAIINDNSNKVQDYLDTRNLNDEDDFPKTLSLMENEEIIENNIDMTLDEMKNKCNEFKKKLNEEKKKMAKLKEIAKAYKKKYKDISLKEEDEKEYNDSYNVKEKMKLKNLPKNIKIYFEGYTKYRELGNFFFSLPDINREIPYFFLFNLKGEDEYKYLIYKQESKIVKINLKNNSIFNPVDLNNYVEEQINGVLVCHFMKLHK